MNYKWIGAILVICSCSAAGFSISASYRREERELRQLISALKLMACELEYRVTPLPELCQQVAYEYSGYVGKLFTNLSRELKSQICPDVQSCFAVAEATSGSITPKMHEAIVMMGSCFGRFDLAGQLCGIESVRSYCQNQLDTISKDRDVRLRSYQTLGLCAGAALAILLV